ncbi:MAG: Ig-like domain-containing protein [Gemmatimonadetes bacterium]|nr:Ig-like domain-containing protein [Gemmatimonadota bacterium]
MSDAVSGRYTIEREFGANVEGQSTVITVTADSLEIRDLRSRLHHPEHHRRTLRPTPLRETLSISPSRPQIRLNQTLMLRASPGLQGQRVEHPVTWVSSEPDIISVSGGFGMDAVIRAVTFGRATITSTTANELTGFVVAWTATSRRDPSAPRRWLDNPPPRRQLAVHSPRPRTSPR